LYLIHPVALPFVDLPLRRLGFVGSSYLITFASQIVVAVLVALLFFLAVERHFISSRQKQKLSSEMKPERDAFVSKVGC
jgi:peptidoglycan/LPS O-acetylase OafA/YrhL